ncbi:amino acid adenylation domain-containing protein [Methanobrevibacter sp.]
MEYPQDRINYIYENSQADYIISDEDRDNALNVSDLLKEENTSNPDVEIVPDDLAYMIYTSGSTGNPKGVMISHENICNQVQNPKSQYKSLLCLATVSFDVSVDDILTSLSNGLKLILASDTQIKNIPELVELIRDEKPEVSEITPSRLASYLEVPDFCEAIKSLKCLFLGGEQFSTNVYENFKKYCDAIVYNSYGPTETTITSNNKEVTDINDITVGLPLHNYVTDVRDIDGKLLPHGVMGELFIGGTSVGKGYYNMPEKTEEVFLEINDIPYYRSGDYAISRPDGEIEILGRIDNQIKLRGLRIEIGEIESNINKYPSVKQAVVVINEINNNDHLCAYYTADEDVDVGDLKEFLKDKLTKYMVPTAYMQLDEMPQTPNGKTDIKALPEPRLDLENIKAEGETEEKLFEIAAELINTDKFGVTDDLYAIGFTSLILMKFNSLIYAEMGINLDISILFNDPTIRKLANEIKNSDDESELEEFIKLADTLDYFPLTENQLGIYYECMQNPDEIRYTMPTAIRFDRDVEAERLKEAIINTVEAHPYLKTRIITTEDGSIKQERNDTAKIDEIEIVKVDSISDEEIIKNDVRAFTFGSEQLFRFKIYETSDETVLFIDFHHIITDGVSQINLLADIANAYENKEISKEIVDGYIYSLIEADAKNSEKYAKSKEFFDEKLSQEIESTVLTPNLNGNPDEGKLKTVLDTIESYEVKEFCNKYSLSQNALILSAITLTLNKYTFSDKTLITTIFNGRSNPFYYDTQGFLVKTLPLIFNNENRQVTIKEFIEDIDEVWKDTISHSEYPYTSISEAYQLKPEFFFTYQEFLGSDGITINNKNYQDYELENEKLIATEYKINFDLYAFDDILEFKLDYNDQLYSEEYIKTFINSIKHVLKQFINSNIEKQRICNIELESQKEIPTFTPVENPFIHKRFEKQAETNPDNIALVAEDATLTAGELNQKANRIANALIKKGVKPKNNVLVMLHRNSDLIASILGILKAGCAYIPIDLEYPQDRINYIYENSQADYIISDEDRDNALNVTDLLKEENTSNPDVEIVPDDLAYMIYTSGSTGNPKGVMISHRNICNQVQNPKSQYKSLLCLATISFDVSVDDILTSLSNGLKLILASDTQIKNIPELVELISDEKPEVSEITPSRLASYLEVPDFCDAIKCLKCLFLGGEQFSTKVFENFKKYCDAIVYNSYGPTETTITSNNKEVTDINDITVGLPLHNYVTDVRDIDGKLLPHGVMGELFIGGTSVGKGYYNMPEKTEEVFLEINNIPYYRSGDYAISRPDGEIEILGRIDNQIKLRGLRIEIGEIESSINRYPAIKQSVVVIKEINNNDHLCAYYTADEDVDVGDLKEFLKDKLTKYMVPTAYMQLDEMPQTPNGKTDTKALPQPKLNLENIKAEGETEEKLFEIAAELINTDKFGVTDDLYAIGFTSLILMKFNSLIYAEMGINLDISILFNDPTIRKLATEIKNSDDESELEEFIKLADTLDYFPLTENQLGVYYECIQSPGEIKYTIPTHIRFDKDVDAEKLKEAVIKVIEAHPYLKTRIVINDEGELKQKRCDDVAIDEIEIVEVDSISEEEIIENDVRAFSFGDEQLFRVKIYKTPSQTVLFTDFHHLITDGVSQINFFEDIANAYEGNEISKEMVDGYVYSLLEDNIKNTDVYDKAKAFFDEKLSHEIESTVLTPNINGNPEEGKMKKVIEEIDLNEIKEFCNRNSFSQNSLFLSSLVMALNKYTFSDKTLITTIFNGRSNPIFYDTQGFLVKTLPLIFNNENRQETIKEFIVGIDNVWKDSMTNSIYPYTHIAENYQLQPEFFFTYQEMYDSEEHMINGTVWEEQELDSDDLNATEYKINFDVDVYDDKIELVIQYNDELYTEDYIRKFLNSIKLILNQFMENDMKEMRVCDIELDNTKEIPTFSRVETPFIHKRFEKQVEANPDSIALVATDATLTNEDLNIKANRIANALIKKGVKAKSNILAMLPRDSNLIATIIGILKAGCTFIPIDLEYPKERIDYIYENSQADYIITAGGKADNALDIYELLEEENTSNPDVEITPDDLAYMIYTSGSTGNPKGVMIGHKNACNQAESNPKCEYSNLLSIATIAFDTSLEDILTGITNGIKIIFANDSEIKNIVDLIKLIKQHKPEVMEFTPSRLISYLEVDEFCEVIDCAKCIVMGGEQFSAKAFNGVKKYCDAAVYNSYGPTEATIASNYKEITDPENITIGKALHNYVTEVRDIDGKLLPQGVMGELYIGGVGVGKGYYNMPEKTDEVYLTINNIPYYRSGDYAIELPDGDIDIKGRIDNQIKLRGLRIEIGEIESSINKFENIKNAVVVIKEINNNDHLCAYFTAEKEIDIDALKEFLKERLTYYMVPTVFMQLDEIPQLPNGKTDTKKLPEPKLELENVKPENETEEKLFEIVSDLIETDEFGTTDDLYAIGYTSLTLMKLNTLIYKEMDVNLDISILFNSPTIKKLADEIINDDGKSSIDEFIELADNLEYFPLTENQLGIYYECMQNPDEIKYTMPSVTRFGKEIDAEKLKQAVIKVIEAHPYLKARIVLSDDGTIKQYKNNDAEIDEIEIIKLDSISDEEIVENDIKAFSLDNKQLFRFKIYDTANETILFSDFHHIITDGESQAILYEEIGKAYENKDLEGEIVDGYVFSLIENDLKTTEKYNSAEEFFDEKLSQEIDSTILTPNLNGNPEEGKYKTIITSFDLSGINEFCLENSIGHNSLFISALILNLNKFTFSNETLITTIFNGRADPNYSNTQGFLVKTLPLIIKNENREQTIEKFIKSVDKTWIDSINNSIYPYTKIADKYQLKPEFFYSYEEGSDSESLVINGNDYESYELSHEGVEAEYKIDMSVFKLDTSVNINLTYNDQLYSEEYIQKFSDSIKTILDQFVGNDITEFRICDIELETTKELPTFAPLENPFVHKRFEAQVESKPNDIALVSNEKEFTYKQLNELSNKVANGLIRRGVEPRHNILIMLPRTSNLIAAIIGVLKAGCGFIPIDMEYPKERIEYIYENSQADYIIANETLDTILDINELLEEENIENPDVEISPDDTAYMIYTSGSTGNPKGVMIGHENACNEVAENPKAEYDNLLSIATIAFDTSLEDILTGITNGIKIIFANDSEIKNIVDLIELIKREKPQVMEFTPSRLLSYLEVDEFCEVIDCAECIVMGGEQFSAKAFNGVKEYSNAKVYNSYGPTEATIASNYKEITDPENITIGKALKNYVTDVRDIDGKLLPQGVMGELYIGGVGVGKGYYNMPEKTEEVYLTINDIPYYRSGDYAIELPDGDIDIKGRIDNQIKLRGLRIEIGEIESNISRFPNIKNVVVIIKEINNTEHLCAYFTAEEEIDIKLLKRYLKNKLTKYMVPTVFIQIDEMPQTPNGKTDLKALPEPSLSFNFVEPETETEKKLFELVSSLSTTEEFGITDDLYTIGFTSLTLMKLNSLIYNETDVNIEITDLFNNPTIQSLADKIDNHIDVQIDVEELIKTSQQMELFPLTSNQLGIYYECAQTEEIKYTMPSAIHFGTDIDPFKLKQAIIDTIEAHPYLKTRIITTPEGELRQKRCDDVEIDDIEIVETDSITNEEMMANDIKYIPLDDNQLFRFKIYKTPEETVLFSDVHHIITDGVSQDLLFDDILSAYSGDELSSEIVDGFVYSLIEQEISENEVSKEFYKNKFSEGFESTVLTQNLNGNPDEAEIKMVSDSINSNFVRFFCQDHSISPNVLFMSATILALNKFTFSDKALITTIFNGRSDSKYFNTQGMLVKTLPIMVSSENRDMLVEDFIKIVDKSWKDALVHSNYPYTKLSEEYQLKPEFFYAYHGAFETDSLELDGNTYVMEDLDGTVATDYKINLDIFDDGENIELYIEYNDQIYTKEYVMEYLNAIKQVLVQFFVNDMDKIRLNEIELAPNFLLPEFEELENPILHKRFEDQVSEKGDEIALVATDASLSYDELNRKANRIAYGLIEKGVKPQSNILIMLPRDSNLIASIIGVLKAGCAFIPLDLKFPKERIDYIYENSQADYIINVDGVESNSLSIKELLENENDENPNVEIGPDDLAYMIYTSGSTGNPKGVMISHENACNQTAENPKAEYDNLLSIATIAFDTSLEDILTGITNGVKIIFANDVEIKNIVDLIRLIKENKPQVMEFTPSRLLSYLEIDEFCEAINCAECIVMGGEQFSAKAFNGVKQYTNAKVYNSYGPTEITIASNYKEITDPENITIGKALHNYVTEVRDIDGKLLPKGVMGELYIGGVGVGKGYYNMPEKTKEVFLTINDIPYYRSGDYAIELPDGDIDIKGRIDNQIKLRGLRIEIGEIESNISSFPNIKQNIVVIKEIRNNEHLCAYFTADEEINKDELKAYLSERLTQYMVPTVFMQIDEMPQTPNGKTDVKALPEPKLELNYVAPKNKIEQTICAIYSSILDIELVGAEDNFFEIGGTSLIASKLIIELLKQGYEVKYDDVFRNQTPRKLASLLSGDVVSDDLDVDIIENYDYTMINNLLEKNTFENFAKGKNLELGNVLLTGVTGFLGIHVLYEYLKSEEGTIYCMLRKGKFDTCEERLIDLMNYYFKEDFTDLIGSRIILSEGDITNLEDFKKLQDYPIDTIVNCAAIVKHYTHDDYIFRVNVDGVVNGLEFAEANNMNYVQISTTSVLDEYTEDTDITNVRCDEKTLYWGQDLSNKYLNSKFLAERMVLEKALSGLNVKIIRVGNLMARYSDGVFQKNFDTNAFLNNIKAIKNLKATTSDISNEIVELSPIDCVAKATLELAKTPKECVVFHAVSDKLIPTGNIIDALNSFGFGIENVTPEEFRDILEQNMDENIQGIITADLTFDDFDLEDEDESESGSDELVQIYQTLDVLDSLGFEWPECDMNYLTTFIKYLNEVHYFD